MMELVLANDVSELRKLPPFLGSFFEGQSIDGTMRMKLRTALDEVLTNCVLYAYDFPGNTVILNASGDETEVSFVVTDRGVEFNPLEYVPDDAALLKVGGLGIAVFRKTFDSITYQRINGENILTLKKNLV